VVPAEHETSRALEVGREVRALVWGVWCGTPCVSISPRFRVVMLLLGRPKQNSPNALDDLPVAPLGSIEL